MLCPLGLALLNYLNYLYQAFSSIEQAWVRGYARSITSLTVLDSILLQSVYDVTQLFMTWRNLVGPQESLRCGTGTVC